MREKKMFVVGYDFDTEAIFGIEDKIIIPLTDEVAKKLRDEYDEHGAVIYRLVKVDPKKI